MKIEKLNDNQIRCILDKNDLEQRELHLSELAYGSSKAKALFSDMMSQAADEFGFEVDNTPLMIEAIPVSMDCLILVVTKVEDPEELDTRFSRFSNLGTSDEDVTDLEMDDEMDDDETDLPFADIPDEIRDALSGDADAEDDSSENQEHSSEDGLMDIMGPFNKAISKAKKELLKKKKSEEKPKPLSDQVYAFDSLDEVVRLSAYLIPFYKGDSLLFKDTAQSVYYLVLKRDDSDENLYKRACTICSDHGECIITSYGSLAYFREHFQTICDHKALKTLHQLNG